MKKFFIITFIVLVIFAAAAGFLVTAASKLALLHIFVNLAPTTPLLPETNILVLGIDDAFGHRSDTIMVLHTDPAQKEASLISIPRDTLAVLPGRGLDKINHAYAYGGVELARKTVEDLLEIEIPHYILVSLAGVINLIDELGGVPINVEKKMYYIDHAGGLYIDLKPGFQRLSGKESMGYIRYRLDGGDFSRIERQQKFLQALANEMFRRDNLLRSPKLFLSLLAYVESDLSSRQTLGLSMGLRSAYELGRVHMATLPGRDMMVDGIYYWSPNLDEIKKMIGKYIQKEQVVSLKTAEARN
jgi:LCP family protein required for cell wall assembly